MPASEEAVAVARQRTKVAVVIGTLEVGGAELDILRNFPRLNREEFEVVVLTFGEPGALAPEVEQAGVRVVSRKGERHSDVREEAGWYNRFVLSLPEGLRRSVRPVKRGVSAVSSWFFGMRAVAWIREKVGAAVYIAHVTRWVGRVLADEQVDIMHAFLPHSYAYGMFACALWRRRAKTVMSRLSLNFYKDSHKVIAWLERNVLHQRVDIAIGNSKLILDELAEEGVARSKLRLLYNGVDPEPFVRAEGDRDLAREAFGIAEDAYVMVAVGNLHEYKGHADLIDACALVRDRMPDDWRLIIGGRDQRGNRAVLERQIAELGLASNVRLLGACENVAQLLKAGDVFVQPSHHEGLPNAFIEAMAASLPVVGTTVGGIPEAVIPENGQAPTTVPGSDASAADDSELGADATTGWLVPPHDPDALGRALLEAAADPLLRAEMGVRAVARVQAQFSLDHSVAAYMAIYRELLP